MPPGTARCALSCTDRCFAILRLPRRILHEFLPMSRHHGQQPVNMTHTCQGSLDISGSPVDFQCGCVWKEMISVSYKKPAVDVCFSHPGEYNNGMTLVMLIWSSSKRQSIKVCLYGACVHFGFSLTPSVVDVQLIPH